ncbi:hypothetical protein GCM10027037_32090 [Mucilaginibacter koreensis]
MSSSYIPKDTYTVCTYQLNAEPKKLIVTRKAVSVFKHAKEKPLLTVDDRNINEEFVCKSPMNTMASFLAFGAGVLVAAVALTNPVGWVVLGCVALAAGAVYAVVTITHKCSGPLKSGSWTLPHPKAQFNSCQAITEVSMLKCNVGGVLKPFFSYAAAKDAAEDIMWNNLAELGLNTVGSFFGGLLLPGALAGATGIAIAKFLGGTVVGIGSMYGLTYAERAALRSDGELSNNQVYTNLNSDAVDSNSFLPTYSDPYYYNPGALGNIQDLKNFAEAYKKGQAGAADYGVQSQLNEIAGLNRQQLYRNATARSLLQRMNNGELPELRRAMTRYNSNRVNPTMAAQAIEANNESFKNNLKAMSRKGGEGLLFFLPMVSTYFTENARKAFAEEALKDMGHGINVSANQPQ